METALKTTMERAQSNDIIRIKEQNLPVKLQFPLAVSRDRYRLSTPILITAPQNEVACFSEDLIPLSFQQES